MSGFSLDRAPHTRPHFEGLQALIRQEKEAARGMADAARASQAFAQGVSHAVSQVAESARALSEAGSGSGRPGGGGGGPSISAGGSDNTGVESGLSQVNDQVAVFGVRVRAALADALMPLQNIAATMDGQFNRVAGTVTEMARRIDASMKFPGWLRAVKGFSASMTFAAQSTRSPAAKVALHFISAAARVTATWRQFGNYLGSLGDVARKSLDRIGAMTLARPAAGARGIAAGLSRVSPTAAAAAVGVRGLGREIAVALGVFGVVYKLTSAVTDFFTSGVKGASDLNETMSAASVTFGRFTGAVEGQADRMARDFGLSKKAQVDVATGFGEMAQGAGMAQKASADFANVYTKLSANLSSRKNIPFAEAAAKVQSALAGQSEPLRQFGVLIDEDAVKIEAVSSGLVRSAKHLDAHAKFLARAALVSSGLASSNGDLARTAGDAANQFRKAGGGVANFGVAVGKVLLPVVKSGTLAFNDLLASVVDLFEHNRPLIESWANAAAKAMDFVGVAVRNAGDIWEIFKLKAGNAASNALSWLEALLAYLPRFAAYMSDNWVKLIADAWGRVVAVFQNAGTYLGEYVAALWEMLENPGSDFKPPRWDGFFAGFKAQADDLPAMIRPALADVSREVDAVWARIAAKEAGRKRFVADEAAAARKPAGAVRKEEAVKFAGLAEAGSKEAYSAVIRHQFGRSDDGIKGVARNTAQQVKLQERANQLLERVSNVNSPPFEVMGLI